MKIALISQNVSPGLLIFREDLIKKLVAEGHEVYALAIDFSSRTENMIREYGAIPVSYSLDKSGFNIFRDFYDTIKLTMLLRKIKPDTVLSFFIKPTLYASVAAFLAGVKLRLGMIEGLGYIYTASLSGFSLKKRLLQRVHGVLSTLCYLTVNKLLFLNPDDLKDLKLNSVISEGKLVEVGPIGVNLRRFPHTPRRDFDKFRFVFVGRLLREKGIFEFVEAAKKLKSINPEVEFLVIGGLDSHNPSALSETDLIDAVDSGAITYVGEVPEVNEWLVSSDVFVLPSYREGYPRSTQEALAIGRAVITTDVPGCRETVIQGWNGILVKPWDVSSLLAAICYMVENPTDVIRMGNNSRHFAEKYLDVDKINERIYRIISGNSPR